MKTNYTHLAFLADRSGSMNSIKEDSEGGINNLIHEQSLEPGEITVTLYDFDDEYRKVFGPVAAKDAPKYVLSPRSMTALNDSLFKAITDTGEFLNSLPEDERPEKVVFVVVTDGHENASCEVTLTQVRESIAHQTDVYNWDFVYLGANVDTDTIKRDYNFGTNVGYVANAASAGSSYTVLSSSLRAVRSKGGTMDAYMPDEIDEDGNAVSRSV